ncbi:MAG: PQQ-binding-like beta-propeller repeat protein [Candidatus Sumerlaeota bacterium]|nr:PQQ-binding-like beta-propeller repeat protein [Candidatus Sumerlaeota bacterium]
MIYVQLQSPGDAARARRAADEAGLYGTRVYVDTGPLSRLHLADNVADALIAVGEAASMPRAEALRVLRPQGKALVGDNELTKPFPAGVDEWSHPYHGPDNNPLSHDQVARAPYLTQFLAEPRYAPLPQAAVASAGRVFKAFGHIAFKTREEPWLNTLAAFNGYNGALLWRREITPGLMVHRNTLIATPADVYFADDKSCKVIDAATGDVKDEIAPPKDVAGGTFWKWMALEEGTLYALLGEPEELDPVIRAKRESKGWPWVPLTPGFDKPETPWGYGKTLLAIDPGTKKILWRHQETKPIDSRALCMKNGRIYAFRFGAYLTCLDAKTGAALWRKTPYNAPQLFAALGGQLNRQGWQTNWRTTAYLKCSDKALYFAGPTIGKLLAVSAADGRVLWEHPYDNYELVLTEDGLYGVSGPQGDEPSRKFDPLTGDILAEINLGRKSCTRPVGCVDAVFCRANEGTTRLDRATNRPQVISPMRAQCHDGVTIANGLLYWWPSVCDCNLTLYGITCLAPAGDFDFGQDAVESERLERLVDDEDTVASLPGSEADWPTFRANNSASATTKAAIASPAAQSWAASPDAAFAPTAPTAVGGLVFLGGSDGIVRALDATTGQLRWKAYTGGDIRYPPTIWQGRALVGSGDGWVYCFEAATGRPLWRFRAAPAERRIPVYGELMSTWPAASGILVDPSAGSGQAATAYAAAGIVNYDGTHVYALDAATGRLKWQNNSSGHLDPDSQNGVSVQGHMILSGGKLYLAGGNAVSPAVYDPADGRCLNDVNQLIREETRHIPNTASPRGCELYEIAGAVRVSGKPLYADPRYPVYAPGILAKVLLAAAGDRAVAWANGSKLMGFRRDEPQLAEKLAGAWSRQRPLDVAPLWSQDCKDSVAAAIGPNAAAVATKTSLAAYDARDGSVLWSQPLPSPPVPWGLAVNRDGRVIVALEGGKVLCFGPRSR